MTNNLEYYKVFYYTAKFGSLTLAAEQLSISQPAVSQSLKQLESVIGTKLFIRAAKGIRLTAEGELLFRYVAKGYEQIEIGEKKVAQMLNLELGEVRIGASDMTLRFFLLPYLETFHERYPGIKVTVTNAPTPETLSYLQEGKIDFGVVSSPFDDQPGIRSVKAKEIEDIFVAGCKFIQYKNKMLDLKELEFLPIISLEKRTSTRSYMDAFLEGNEVVMNPEFELATSDMIVQFALRNLGVGSVMKEFATEYLDAGKLFALRFNKIIPKRHFCIVTATDSLISTAAGNLLQVIYEDVKEVKA
ncbi:LysR family transcriptional regulator [Kineothrix sp. MB12-C1]|uniref:LysR family transcriptional regulator n=1 Tax=Kineothrix sp. MB12-C1 TaxID=3070215 RepID=UPI0027D35175|nr:LysR family transcriptional regulator [Kineothrix sp. MB12-C1]WMC93529.1 LysR family transcriptional regulator [Kineothrix sp. MB12-C1]